MADPQYTRYFEETALAGLLDCGYDLITGRMVRYGDKLTYDMILWGEATGLLLRKHEQHLYSHTDYFLTGEGRKVLGEQITQQQH